MVALRPIPDLQRTTDYDGDGKADIVTYRPSDGTWHIIMSSDPNHKVQVRHWGRQGDIRGHDVGDLSGDDGD